MPSKKVRFTVVVALLVMQSMVIAGSGAFPLQKGVKTNVLFIGNSLVGSKGGGLPAYVEAALKAGGYESSIGEFKAVLYWSQGLEFHWNKGTAATEIKTKKYDVVILQGWSLDRYYYDDFSKYVKLFNDLIKENGGQSLLFSRWDVRPKDGESLQKFNTAQDLLINNYDRVGKELNIPVVPITAIWKDMTNNPPAGQPRDFLYKENKTDGQHQGEAGKWLCALAFYSFLTHSSPLGVNFTFGTESPSIDVQSAIQKATWDIIAQRESWASGSQSNFLILNPTTVSFSSDASSKDVSISTDKTGLTATANQSWISSKISAGKLILTVEKNQTGATRSAVVTVKGGGLTKTVDIIQEKIKLCNFSVSVPDFIFNFTAETKSLIVTTDSPWVATTDASWIKLQKSGKTLSITVEKNPSKTDFREGSITIKGCDEVKVAVQQNFEDDLNIPVKLLQEEIVGFNYDIRSIGSSLRYMIQKDHYINVELYSLLGKKIVTLHKGFIRSGVYEIDLSSNHANSGMYIVQLKSSDITMTKTITIK